MTLPRALPMPVFTRPTLPTFMIRAGTPDEGRHLGVSGLARVEAGQFLDGFDRDRQLDPLSITRTPRRPAGPIRHRRTSSTACVK